MADIAKGVLFILACAGLYGLAAFLFRDEIKELAKSFAISRRPAPRSTGRLEQWQPREVERGQREAHSAEGTQTVMV